MNQRINQITPQIVETIPSALQDGVLYISLKYSTAVHRCCCGCGTKVVTPLSPAHWELSSPSPGLFTLHPSIGNWNHPCQAHYLIQRNRVVWAEQMTRRQIERGRALTQAAQDRHFGRHGDEQPPPNHNPRAAPANQQQASRDGLISRFFRWLAAR